MSRKKFKKSTWISLALFIYISAMAVYFLPRNTEISETEKYITLAVAYVIVFVLWIVLRKKEQLKEKRENDVFNNSQEKNN
ncbi:hypothetical protein [Bacteroides sp. 519]|uniref:hypothetical protein n=1 Tax=Bacteroides sp. 519 TaxID=2302937 RepID=UPI0013D45A05|nr:hypothetical protein [Bacteroides sp. 519]NDV58116.1 hypothetical protein [Bacteroides sp. 519]